MVANTTPNRGYQLPDARNNVNEDIYRLINALLALDVDIATLLSALAGKANTGHTHGLGDVAGLQTALDGKASSAHTHTLAGLADVEIAGAPAGRPLTTQASGKIGIGDEPAPKVHGHEIAAIVGLAAALAALAPKNAPTFTNGLTVGSGNSTFNGLIQAIYGQIRGEFPGLDYVNLLREVTHRVRTVMTTAGYKRQSYTETANPSAPTFVADDYIATAGPNGVTQHQWNLAGVLGMRLNSTTGLTLAVPLDAASIKIGGAPLALPKSYKSPEQTITSSGPLVLAHGLGVAPNFVTAELVCKTADLNHAIGDVVPLGLISPGQQVTTSLGTYTGLGVVVDATNLTCRYADSPNVFEIMNKNGGFIQPINPARWRLIVRAFA
ncbi:hypothetical protein [Stappia indica]|uniref:Phage tail repeat like n=1 Tax=Stappia indica TaxID=538381 RepID=A0A285TTF0_9HYPH|nr:hypothetical protein [Stappia indica]SOC14738.1 Phage tail repeat like [Stappia indica]SOC27348.1 Phage tail repeat like [Stappia indica]